MSLIKKEFLKSIQINLRKSTSFAVYNGHYLKLNYSNDLHKSKNFF